ncbi:MAG: hypothetical protein JJU40_04380, partial [Rhodobacteraceae bacterium]|nr:hypothetical protein [Paracoccaceae bacterium]
LRDRNPTGNALPGASTAWHKKRRPHKAGVKSLRQVSYRQETYRAVTTLYACMPSGPRQNFEKTGGDG